MTTTGRCTAAAVAAAALLLAAPASAGSDPWQALKRPLHIPDSLRYGRCPITGALPVALGLPEAQGQGPLYALDAYPALRISGTGTWRSGATRWLSRPGFSGRVLIRGRRVNGNDPVAFGPGDRPAVELRLIIPRRAGWSSVGADTRVHSPGCFAWQIDGARFSRVVVFHAVAPGT
jgi:hypothetical protein